MTDPVEAIIAAALDRAGIAYTRPGHGSAPGNPGQTLDFHLPAFDTFIECKRMATPRTESQMATVANIIVIQGIDAARALAALISKPENP